MGYLSQKNLSKWIYSSICTHQFIKNLINIVTKLPKTVKTINNHQIIVKNCDKHANNHQTIVIIGDNVRQKSVDMGLRPRKNMYGWVGFFSFGPHTPVTFLDKYPPGT